MGWMSDGFTNLSKEILERPSLRDRQTEEHLSNKNDEKNSAKGVSHLFQRILTYLEQSFNRLDDRRVKLNWCASLLASRSIYQASGLPLDQA